MAVSMANIKSVHLNQKRNEHHDMDTDRPDDETTTVGTTVEEVFEPSDIVPKSVKSFSYKETCEEIAQIQQLLADKNEAFAYVDTKPLSTDLANDSVYSNQFRRIYLNGQASRYIRCVDCSKIFVAKVVNAEKSNHSNHKTKKHKCYLTNLKKAKSNKVYVKNMQLIVGNLKLPLPPLKPLGTKPKPSEDNVSAIEIDEIYSLREKNSEELSEQFEQSSNSLILRYKRIYHNKVKTNYLSCFFCKAVIKGFEIGLHFCPDFMSKSCITFTTC